MGLRRWFATLRRRCFGQGSRPSLGDLDHKLERYLDFPGGFFIEAGANDGYSQSNTYFLERKKGWRGILVEGIPELWERCRKTRANSRVYHCALVGPDFPHPTVTMHFANLMSVVEGALRTREAQAEHLRKGIAAQGLNRTYSVEVPARTLESILDEIPRCPPIDFLSLDVEGLEVDVLRGLNLARYRPRYILVEARYFDDVDALLTGQGYQRLEKLSYHDYLYADGRGARSEPVSGDNSRAGG